MLIRIRLPFEEQNRQGNNDYQCSDYYLQGTNLSGKKGSQDNREKCRSGKDHLTSSCSNLLSCIDVEHGTDFIRKNTNGAGHYDQRECSSLGVQVYSDSEGHHTRNPALPEGKSRLKKITLHHPYRPVARMIDDLAGDTAEDKLLTSRKTLSPNHDGTVFGLVFFCQDAIRS